jgi:hypothetical protein
MLPGLVAGEPLGARGQLNEGSFAIFNLLRSSDKVAHLEKRQPARRYQQFAARCLEKARATADPRLKAFLAEMAQEWQRLVEEAKGERGKRDFRGPEEDPGD